MTFIYIDGTTYDITNFIHLHPGGSVIKFYSNSDATAAFNEFHYRSKYAKKLLKSLPILNNTDTCIEYPDNKELLNDFYILKQKLIEKGFFIPSINHILERSTEICFLFFIACFLFYFNFFNFFNFFTIIPCFLFGLAEGRSGWLMHEAGHYSLTGNIKTDRNIQFIFYGLGCGMSASYWRNQHNKHHASPQKINHDVDLDTLPLVAFHKKIAEKVQHPIGKLWIKYQAFLFFPFITTFVVLFWQFYLHPRFSIRTRNYRELSILATRLTLWYILSTFYSWNLYKSILIYIAKTVISANYIFINFAVSHTHRDIVPENEYRDWVTYSAEHTTNCNPSLLCNWWMSYLNFQIEHHLFPSLPQFRSPLVSPYVKSLFKKHGLKYDSRDYFQCLYDTFNNLHHVSSSKLE